MEPIVFQSPRPLFAVLVSLAAVPLIVASRSRPNLREFWTLAASLAKAGVVLSLVRAALSMPASPAPSVARAQGDG